MKQVPTDGTAIGNTMLMKILKWSETTYWEIKKGLVERGELQLGRGRGGSVRRPMVEATVATSSVSPSNVRVQKEDDYARESRLYNPMSKVIRDSWAADAGFENKVVHTTAQGGGRVTGGKWSRPDIALATLSRYPYVPGIHFDVITFEVKTPDGIDITCVYEALAHLRSATQSYVLLHVPSERALDLESILLDVSAEAKNHGIGVIIAEKPSDYETWDEVVEPVRAEPVPKRLNDFLAQQFSEKQREQISRWW